MAQIASNLVEPLRRSAVDTGWVDAEKEFGISGGSSADQLTLLQQASDEAGSPGILLPSGTIRVSDNFKPKYGVRGVSPLGVNTVIAPHASFSGDYVVDLADLAAEYQTFSRLFLSGGGLASVSACGSSAAPGGNNRVVGFDQVEFSNGGAFAADFGGNSITGGILNRCKFSGSSSGKLLNLAANEDQIIMLAPRFGHTGTGANALVGPAIHLDGFGIVMIEPFFAAINEFASNAWYIQSDGNNHSRIIGGSLEDNGNNTNMQWFATLQNNVKFEIDGLMIEGGPTAQDRAMVALLQVITAGATQRDMSITLRHLQHRERAEGNKDWLVPYLIDYDNRLAGRGRVHVTLEDCPGWDQSRWLRLQGDSVDPGTDEAGVYFEGHNNGQHVNHQVRINGNTVAVLDMDPVVRERQGIDLTGTAVARFTVSQACMLQEARALVEVQPDAESTLVFKVARQSDAMNDGTLTVANAAAVGSVTAKAFTGQAQRMLRPGDVLEVTPGGEATTNGSVTLEVAFGKIKPEAEIEPFDIDGIAGWWDPSLHDGTGGAADKPFALTGSDIDEFNTPSTAEVPNVPAVLTMTDQDASNKPTVSTIGNRSSVLLPAVATGDLAVTTSPGTLLAMFAVFQPSADITKSQNPVTPFEFVSTTMTLGIGDGGGAHLIRLSDGANTLLWTDTITIASASRHIVLLWNDGTNWKARLDGVDLGNGDSGAEPTITPTKLDIGTRSGAITVNVGEFGFFTRGHDATVWLWLERHLQRKWGTLALP